MRVRGFDTETFLIGPNAIAPKMVCASIAERFGAEIRTELLGNGDDVVPVLIELLQVDGNLLVIHNAAYDLTVLAISYPELEPLIWAKLEAGEVHCTLLRERLLNLSRHGKLDSVFLPDGSAKQIRYHLSDLVLSYLGIDVSALKTGDDVWRLRYSELDGLKAKHYPKDAADYAKGDAMHHLLVWEQQGEVPDASLETQEFQTAADFALACITLEGMPIDPVMFGKVAAMLAEELSSDKMLPLVIAGILTPEEPARPYSRQLKKARGIINEWTGIEEPTSDDYLAWREELEAAGIKFTPPEPTHLKEQRFQQRVLAVLVAQQTLDDVEVLFKMPFDKLLALAEEKNVLYAKTPTGNVSTASEVIDDTADLDELLTIFQHRQNLQKMVTTELPRMTWDGHPAKRVHFRYTALVESGRTSCRAEKLYPSANGQNVDPRARPIFVPPPGFLICSTDFSTLELGCVAQVTLDKFGASVHAEKINAGYDLHCYLGAQLARMCLPSFRDEVEGLSADDTYEFFYHGYYKSADPVLKALGKHWRNFAKPIGLGFPGGLGPHKIIGIAKKTYGVDIVAEALSRFETNPEEFDLENKSVIYYAKKLHGMEADEIRWTPLLKGIAFARRLKDIWLDTYPEMVDYFATLTAQRKARQKASTEDEDKIADDFEYTSPFGMLRRGCSYTSAANGEVMQTPAAEGFKTAVFNLVRATRDSTQGSPLFGHARVCNEIHDETLTFLREEQAHELAMGPGGVREIMEESMKLVLRDVKVTAVPCLMRRWYKQAEPAFDSADRLVPWEPKQ